LTRGGDARHILVVQALRAFVYGLGSVLIGVTLADLGLSGLQVGLVLSALIAGTAIVSVILARSGDQIGRRRWYVGLLALMALSGTVFALTDSVWLLVLVALTGTVSTEVVESGPFTSLEQAMLPNAAEGHDPTRLFGTYNTIATLAGSLGALAAIATRWVKCRAATVPLCIPRSRWRGDPGRRRAEQGSRSTDGRDGRATAPAREIAWNRRTPQWAVRP